MESNGTITIALLDSVVPPDWLVDEVAEELEVVEVEVDEVEEELEVVEVEVDEVEEELEVDEVEEELEVDEDEDEESLKISTKSEYPLPFDPPANIARFPTVVAAKAARACDRVAVLHEFDVRL